MGDEPEAGRLNPEELRKRFELDYVLSGKSAVELELYALRGIHIETLQQIDGLLDALITLHYEVDPELTFEFKASVLFHLQISEKINTVLPKILNKPVVKKHFKYPGLVKDLTEVNAFRNKLAHGSFRAVTSPDETFGDEVPEDVKDKFDLLYVSRGAKNMKPIPLTVDLLKEECVKARGVLSAMLAVSMAQYDFGIGNVNEAVESISDQMTRKNRA